MNGHNFSHRCLIRGYNISRCSKLNNGSSREFQIVIHFHTKVRFRRRICQDALNSSTKALEKFKRSLLFTRRSDSGTEYIETLEIEQRKLSINSNGHYFSLGDQIQVHNISRCSKLNYGSSREIQMVITFLTEVRFRRIIYREARN